MEHILRTIKKIIPEKFFRAVVPAYHFILSFFAALFYRFPSRHIFIIGVTGTKGKTTVVELINAMCEEAGYKTAISNSLRFKVGVESYNNTFKMTMPGRFFLQSFLRKAIRENCSHAILEMTSEGAKQHRHRFISLNALVFTNLAPEHIESHGSYENYRDAKLEIAHSLERSRKKRKFIVVNADDAEADKFLNVRIKEKYSYSLKDALPYELKKRGMFLTFENTRIETCFSGLFNIYNILAAAVSAKHISIGGETIKSALQKCKGIPGRMEYIDEGQDFTVIVDYAHTPDSLQKVYEVFHESNKICVLGAAGGGRDEWKREVLGSIANTHCSTIILTNEDPYDENPLEIVYNIQKGITEPIFKIVIDRREAIRHALKEAKTGDVVIITGKGSELFIMGPSGVKIPWSDAGVVREELKKILEK
ncbi:MAG: UDP-N-acetylmuramyl-tripeptide synthetase [bacterium]|nr:UDP-N-acetylmuramyl-tripeptide synthetase [bacterium]